MDACAGILGLVGLVATVSPGAGEPERLARAAAYAFLARGEGAPRPEVTLADVEHAGVARVERRLAAHGEGCLEVHFPAHGPGVVVLVTGVASGDARVVGYAAQDRPFLVARTLPCGAPRPEADVAREVASRTRFDAGALEARALAFLGRSVRGFAQRAVRRYRAEVHAAGPVEALFAWEEEPGPGALAVYPNRFLVWLSPETGEVTRYLGTDVEAVLRAPPPVDRAAAEAAAARRFPVAPHAASRLSFTLREGRPRAVWLVPLAGSRGPVLVDGEDASLLVRP